jgi:diacylglycerol kinase family enzyme/membrane-associated phospholipid phosphatase
VAGTLFGSLVAAFLGWTWLVVGLGLGDPFDALFVPPTIPPRSGAGQILEAWALATYPGIVYAIVGGYAVWAYQRRLRRLALAIALTIPTGWFGYWLLKAVIRRPRPESPFADALTYDGFAYPSGHVVAMTTLMATVVTLATAQRRSPRTIWAIRLGGSLMVAAVAADRSLLRHHWPSDVVGGALYGGVVVSAALILGDARRLGDSLGFPGRPTEHVDKRAAIIVNPSKVTDFDLFRRRVDYELLHRGWRPPLWLETAIDDPGRQMAADALARGADLVIVAGGDGTVRTVCSELAGTGVPIALVPAGTGNLLARNLGIPLDEDAALTLAFVGTATAVDLIRYRTDAGSGHFVVMSGIGFDAAVMAQTNPELKRLVGSAAYFLAAAQQVGAEGFEVSITLDDAAPVSRNAVMVLVGNVGSVQGGIQVFPAADPYDGSLDVLVANPTTVLDWAKVATGLLGADVEPLEFARAQKVSFVVPGGRPYQLDGDAEGTTTFFEAEVVRGGMRIVLPTR